MTPDVLYGIGSIDADVDIVVGVKGTDVVDCDIDDAKTVDVRGSGGKGGAFCTAAIFDGFPGLSGSGLLIVDIPRSEGADELLYM